MNSPSRRRDAAEPAKKQRKKDRLARALKENLRRRKANAKTAKP